MAPLRVATLTVYLFRSDHINFDIARFTVGPIEKFIWLAKTQSKLMRMTLCNWIIQISPL